MSIQKALVNIRDTLPIAKLNQQVLSSQPIFDLSRANHTTLICAFIIANKTMCEKLIQSGIRVIDKTVEVALLSENIECVKLILPYTKYL